ncbi:MAG: tyrosine-type recombinase/integrase [Acidimicrobiales bacterium]
MPARPEGVYRDGSGGWYVKVSVGRDPLTGWRTQVTRRGFETAAEAGRARRELQAQVDRGQIRPAAGTLTIDALLDLYLDGIDADGRLSAKTRFDYRHSADDYVRPYLGARRVRDVTPEVVLAWQRKLTKEGGTKDRKPLSANTVRLARAPLAGAYKMALGAGMVAVSPLVGAPRPRSKRSIPRHWSPEQAREFLALMEGERTWPVWAFLLGSGLRIGELVALRWPSVDLEAGAVRVVEFVSTLGHQIVPSAGKSREAVRTIDLDPGLVRVLSRQRKLQAGEQLASSSWEQSEYVFTKVGGGPYHPQRLSRLLGTYSAEVGLPRLTAHGLRHTSATLMLASGVAPKVAAERLGHADPTLFTNLYSHVTPTMQREAASRIGAALFGDDISR